MSASYLVFCENLQLTAVVSFCNARTNNVFVMLQKAIKGSCKTSRKKTKPFGDQVISEELRKGFRNIFYNILKVYLGPYLTYMMEKVVIAKVMPKVVNSKDLLTIIAKELLIDV